MYTNRLKKKSQLDSSDVQSKRDLPQLLPLKTYTPSTNVEKMESQSTSVETKPIKDDTYLNDNSFTVGIGPLLDVTMKGTNGHSIHPNNNVMCTYSIDGTISMWDKQMNMLTSFSTECSLVSVLFLTTHLITVEYMEDNSYCIQSISIYTDETVVLYVISRTPISFLFEFNSHVDGFIAVDLSGQILFFSPKRSDWKIDCIRSVGCTVNNASMNQERSHLFLSTDAGIVFILQCSTGDIINIDTGIRFIFSVLEFEHEGALLLVVTSRHNQTAVLSLRDKHRLYSSYAEHHEYLDSEITVMDNGVSILLQSCIFKEENYIAAFRLPSLVRIAHIKNIEKQRIVSISDLGDFYQSGTFLLTYELNLLRLIQFGVSLSLSY